MERKTEHPILFSTPMVQAILEGRKTMTRRIVRTPKNKGEYKGIGIVESNGILFAIFQDPEKSWVSEGLKFPYGMIGDKLWVRETFFDCSKFKDYPLFNQQLTNYIFKADNTSIGEHKWKPSLFMPKAAARIWLEITGIRVERLHEITEEDAKSEGAEFQLWQTLNNTDTTSYKNGFTSLWLHINGDESWNANPWVWVIEFKRIEKC